MDPIQERTEERKPPPSINPILTELKQLIVELKRNRNIHKGVMTDCGRKIMQIEDYVRIYGHTLECLDDINIVLDEAHIAENYYQEISIKLHDAMSISEDTQLYGELEQHLAETKLYARIKERIILFKHEVATALQVNSSFTFFYCRWV